jgi:hypothetical protein
MHLLIYTIYKFEKVANVKSFVKGGSWEETTDDKATSKFCILPQEYEIFLCPLEYADCGNLLCQGKNKYLLSFHRSKILNTVCRQIIYWYLDVTVPIRVAELIDS